jgi:probable HAF family extracellular repeat protein
MTDLGTLGGRYSAALGINASGQVVGGASTAGSENQSAFLWQSGTMTNLDTVGGIESSAYAVNASGQVVISAVRKRARRNASRASRPSVRSSRR